MSDLLLEIGCENLPPAAIRPAFEDLRGAVAKRLDELRLPFDDIYTTGSPRRLVVIVRGLAPRQMSESETVTGPPVSKAFDENGNPTKAAVGFAKSQAIAVSDLKTIATDRGDYLGFVRKLKSAKTGAILKDVVPEWIQGMRFPKTMHWESSGLRFARPIRWLICLYGESVVRVELAGVRSGRLTYTIPWIQKKGITVKGASHYLKTITKAGVVLDHEKRYEKIQSLAKKAATKEKLSLIEDATLFDELTFMLEDPRPLVGSFDKKYLALPPEVVITAMKGHQRYLALRGRGGKLVPKFVTFTEGRVGAPASVRNGNEKVLRARLEDAMFYWHEDVTTGMDGLANRLESVVFLEGMGSLRDKAARVNQLGRTVNEVDDSEEPVSTDLIHRATSLAKADLASEMIKDGKEFTLLQGLIGSFYAEEADEQDEIVLALREQYLPRFAGDDLPASRLGFLLSVADRVDTIAGCFLAGLAPTGSQDPYALRRQANGLIRMIESRPGVHIDHLLSQAVQGYVDSGLADAESAKSVMKQLIEFFKTRAAARLKEKGISYDIVGAVSGVAWAVPGIALDRARAFQELRGNESFELLITGAKRVGNILDTGLKILGADWAPLEEAFVGSGVLDENTRFDRTAFSDNEETQLADAIQKTIPRLEEFEKTSDSRSILQALAQLGPSIDDYFDRVLVNCPDPALRANRHQFLAAVFALFSKYADFSHIVEEGKV